MVDYMKKQSASKVDKLGITVAGKTGTPERIFKGRRINDGWYVFFAPKPQGPGHIVTCIRIEDAKGSSEAVKLAGRHVIPFLLQRGYIKSFEPAATEQKIIINKPEQLNKQPDANDEEDVSTEADTTNAQNP
jgi:hypothetical protein